jgi:cell division protein FtsI (penicillin-binding protein 3)
VRNLDPARARWIRTRMGVLCGLMGLALGGIVSSAWRVQIEDGPEWREMAEKQRQRRLHVEPKRGTIYDRNGTPLAVTVEVPSVSADIAEMLRGVDGKPEQDAVLHDAALRLGQTLSIDPAEMWTKLEPRHRFVWLKRRVTGDEAEAVRDLGDPKKQAHPIHGLTLDGEGHRSYPGRELASTVLGFVAPDGQGKDGLELALDDDLRGRVEDVRGLRDRTGRLIFEGANDARALQGYDVTLSIDEGIQHVAERELDAAMHTYETKGGSLAVVDPSTGEILALASVPGYNPNDYSDSDPDARRDRPVTDRFEPGSVMKPFMMAGALAAGAVKPTDQIYCEHGVYQVAGITVHDDSINDMLTPTQILAKSSNIGALKIGLELGEPSLYATLRRFGFGEPTGLPVPGEASGVLRPKGRPWYDAETATASFGQGISVTTLQLAMAMSALANGGKLLEPILVERVLDGRGTTIRENSPRVRREVVSPGVARTVAEMLTAVTEPGCSGCTGVQASIPGFRVAGKTGTAQMVDPATGKYSAERWTATFVGFVPVDHPRIVVAVVLDEPTLSHHGGDLAGPVFRRVAEATLRYLGVTPSASASSANLSTVRREADLSDANPTVPRPAVPTVPTPLPPTVGAVPPGSVRVPDATGLPAHDVVVSLTKAGLVPRIEGWGRAVRQEPAAGTAAPMGASVRVVFEPAS